MLSTTVQHLARAACHNAAPALLFSRLQYATSSEVISKWQAILSQVAEAPHPEQQTRPLLQAEHLRQLLNDAIHVYRTEGAAAVVPDQVTEVFMGVYSSLHSQQQQLLFFTLLAREFGIQSGAVDAAVQLWQEKSAANSTISPELLHRLADRLAAAAQPLYMQLLLPVSQHKAGIAFLVRLRSDLLQLLKQQPGLPQGAALRSLSQDLRSAFARWFGVGLLQLKRITWEDTPGQLLERVMMAEAVHRMQRMEELKRRLQSSDRRVFAFLHPSLHFEPLVVLHTAIMDHIPSSMEAVLAEPTANAAPSPAASSTAGKQQQQLVYGTAASPVEAGSNHISMASNASSYQHTRAEAPSSEGSATQHEPDSVACFYSISSGQPGLSGVDLGNFLIKKAAQQLLAELPQLQHLVTLSPIPGFRAWLITKLQQEEAAAASLQGSAASMYGQQAAASQHDSASFLQHHEGQVLADAHRCLAHMNAKQQQQQQQQQQGSEVYNTVAASKSSSHGSSSSGSSSSSSQACSRSAAAAASMLLELIQSHAWVQLPEYQQQQLQHVFKRLCAVYLLKEKRRGVALDPVQHFHLKNGAWLWRINCRADLSDAGLDRSCGLMVNYKYVLGDVSANNRAYLVDHVIAASESLRQLLQTEALI